MGFKVTGEPPVIKSSLAGKHANHIHVGEHYTKSLMDKTLHHQPNDHSFKRRRCEVCRHDSQIWNWDLAQACTDLKASEKQMNNYPDVILKTMYFHLVSFMKEKGHHPVKITGFNHQLGFGQCWLEWYPQTHNDFNLLGHSDNTTYSASEKLVSLLKCGKMDYNLIWLPKSNF